ncbi:MAG: potassium transporter Kup [Ignavibacteriales bacterium CG12_big_fil_rev_8_21_14_0_65_30_8]|nr:MAG: potassium transporter Kup [Ignavibacteriales bacterium CG12_big_fil_rev_8_21_14_0_65_30_8]
MLKSTNKFSSFKDITKAAGLVFGDIGTSPIYTLTIIFAITAPTIENLMGVLSLLFWTLIILVTVKYAWLAMSLSIKGEGGIIVLKEILLDSLKSGRKIVFATFLGVIGVSLIMGDGVITPAISILSAVEGLELIPLIGHISINTIILITCIITVLLFSFQFLGTDKVASSFGPIMILWFASLFISGMIYIIEAPQILTAVSPHYAIEFMANNGLTGFFILSEVILCATGGEALYADMGHLGAKPIKHAWYFVFFALLINYFGQGAYVVSTGNTNLILFSMIESISNIIYIPFLILTLFATIIASQAMITAIMSLVYQGITTRMFPLMKIKFTSTQFKSQIYIGAVNWGLLIAVLFMIISFKKSGNIAAAYGFAVTASMVISSIFMIWIFKFQKKYFKMSVTYVVLIVSTIFLIALFDKIPHGGYWSIIIALLPFIIIQLWARGNKSIRKSFRALPIDTFLFSYNQIYGKGNNIKGTALFFTRNFKEIPPYIVHCMLRCNIVYENNILVSIRTTEKPYGMNFEKIDNLAHGLSGIKIDHGYMEIIDIQSMLKKNNIKEKVIYYGVDEISTKNPLLKVFAFLKKMSPSFVNFYTLPYNKLHGVLTRLEI